MRNAAFVQAIAGTFLIADVLTGFGGMLGLAAPLFLYMSTIGFVFPNAVAIALASHGRIAGMASALLGTLQFSMAGVAVLVLGAINSTRALPMAVTIFVCGVFGVVTHLFMLGSCKTV
jgi:DHA1 family bicyclomycin/chloramphenicol resistance-like MFS transporter